MRSHLIEAGLAAFAEHGVGASIDDIIAAADVSRGTFYNYFQTSHEVLAALGDSLATELVELLYATLASHDAAHRVGLGIRLFLHVAQENERFASFMWRTGFHAATAQIFLQTKLVRDIEIGMVDGQFRVPNADTGLLSVVGITLAGTFALSSMSVSRALPEQLAHSALLALGTRRELADKICALPLPAVAYPETSLLAHSRVG